jgi:23S rRNA pseudouridine2605 synthase
VRINQFVAGATGLSRRAADTAITAGRVIVDGKVAKLGQTVTDSASVTLDGQPITLTTTHTYIMLNKPAGYVASRVRQGDDPTLYDLLPPDYRKLRTVGRLDRDSSGLILLTDDGAFIQTHTHPSFEKEKVYELTLTHPLTPADRQWLEAGVKLTDGPSRLKVTAATGQEVTVSLSEGRNRQIRRTLGALGYTITRLHRTHMGRYSLGDLPSGNWKAITAGGPS